MASSKQTVLIANWRDPQSPLAGGAEKITQKYAEYWAQKGHRVVWVTNSFPDSVSKETLRRVQYIRISPSLEGTILSYFFKYPVYLWKTAFFLRKFVNQYQNTILIDEIHGLPFFTPLFLPQTKIVLLVCEVAGPIWDKMFSFPINTIGKFLEKFIYRLYASKTIWAISENTKKDILEILPHKKDVEILPLGVDQKLPKGFKAQKEKTLSIVFLARLVPMKGIEVTLGAIALVIQKIPTLQLVVIGRGQSAYQSYLYSLVKELGLQKNVFFVGHCSEEEKFFYLSAAQYILNPSYKEGFGLTVLEAGLVGTPAIVRGGSSLESLVQDRVNGFVFYSDDQLAETILRAVQYPGIKKLSQKAHERALQHTWEHILKDSEKITEL